MTPIQQHEGSKYLVSVFQVPGTEVLITPGGRTGVMVDVYEIINACQVADPARVQAIKKLLFAGRRGKGTELQDLVGADAALSRAIETQKEFEANDKIQEVGVAPTDEFKESVLGAVGLDRNGGPKEETVEELRERVKKLGERNRQRCEETANLHNAIRAFLKRTDNKSYGYMLGEAREELKRLLPDCHAPEKVKT